MGSLSFHPMILRSEDACAYLRINRVFTDEFSLTSEDLARKPLLEWIHPDDREALKQQLNAGRGCVRARHGTKGNQWLSLEWQVQTQDVCAIALGLPHRAPEVLLKSPKAGVALEYSTLTETLESMVRIVESKTGGLRWSNLLVDAEHRYVSVGAGPSLPAEYNAAIEGLAIGPTVGSCGTVAFWNVPVVVENIDADPLWKDLRGAAAIAGVASCWSVPITATDNGQALGAMALYDTKPNAPSRGEMDILEIAARMVGLAIERDRLEEQLRQSSKIEAVGVLVGGIAHDFNNLLAAIMGNSEIAMAGLPADAPAQLNLKQIVKASVTAADLCNQLLTYAGRGATTTEVLDCNALVKELGDLLQVALSKKMTLEFEIHEASLGMVADRSQLRQVIMNLITNASGAIG